MKNIIKKIILIIICFVSLLFFFEIARLFFVIYNFNLYFGLSFWEVAKSFLYGLKLDLSLTAYIIIPIVFIFILSAFIKNSKFIKISLISYSILIVFLASIVIVGDAETYCHWGFRLDRTPLDFLSTPSAIIGNITIWKLLFLILIIICFTSFSFFFLWFFIIRRLERIGREKYYSFFYLIIIGLLIIPLRGGIGIVPINVGSVYYSKNTICNNTAINVVWNLANSLIYNKIEYNKFKYFDEKESEKIFNEMKKSKNLADTMNYKFSILPDNIIFIVLESFTKDAVSCIGGENLTPNIDAWSKKGILFNNFYANCDRSDKALVAIFSSIPSLLHNSLMKSPEKSIKLPSIIKSFSKIGFHSAFYYGGDINFANMKSYIYNIGFEDIICQNNYDIKNANISKWGYADEYMFSKLYSDIEKSEGKNIFALFTLSSHEPYDLPNIKQFSVDNEWDKARNSYLYVDSCLNVFLSKMKTSAKWQNSLIVLVSDHGTLFPGGKEVWNKEKYQALMLFLGASVEKEPFIYTLLADQCDIAKTLCEQYNISTDEYIFGDNLFHENSESSFFSFVNGFGFLKNSSSYIYNVDNNTVFQENGDFLKKDIFAKSYMQKIAKYYKSLE